MHSHAHLARSHKAFADGICGSPCQLLEQDAGGQLGKHAFVQAGKQLVWQFHTVQEGRQSCSNGFNSDTREEHGAAHVFAWEQPPHNTQV